LSKTTETKGSVMIGLMLIALALLAFVLPFVNWGFRGQKANQHAIETQKALYNAESGYSAALDWIRRPANVIAPGTTKLLTSMTVGSTYYISLTASANNLIDIVTTGYYYIHDGSFVDSHTGQNAQQSVIEARVQADSLGSFFAAVPGLLNIAPGTDASGGMVYGKTLQFSAPINPLQITKVKAAFYFNTVTPGTAPGFVQYTPPTTTAIKLPTEPNLPTLDAPLRSLYLTMAGGLASADILADGTVLTGALPAPSNTYGIYYCPGNITLGPLSVSSPVTLYCTGTISIADDISTDNPNAHWLAMLAEGDVTVTSVSSNISIEGTIITNGTFTGGGAVHPLSDQLSFKGGFVALKGANIASYWLANRLYTYQAPPTTLFLPLATETISYHVSSGKYYM
jgi:hypothetical protein